MYNPHSTAQGANLNPTDPIEAEYKRLLNHCRNKNQSNGMMAHLGKFADGHWRNYFETVIKRIPLALNARIVVDFGCKYGMLTPLLHVLGAGKIIGIGCVGLTQYAIWIAFALLLTTVGAAYLGLGGVITAIPPATFFYFILFYLLGYFLYATLYAGIGAVCTTEQEAQQSQFPIIAMLIVPLLLITMIIKNPDGPPSTILSLIPFFSPMLMFLRINVGTPSIGQILGSIALLLATIVVMIWLVARIFRVGLLMYGKKPSLPEVLRWAGKR